MLADITMDMMNSLGKSIVISIAKPCPCGNFTDPKEECICTPIEITKHIQKICPFNDHHEMVIEVPKLDYKRVSRNRCGESTEVIAARIKSTPRTDYSNVCELVLDDDANALLKTAILELGISALSYDSIMRVARTIADMDHAGVIRAEHISEAIGYRCLDRNMWT